MKCLKCEIRKAAQKEFMNFLNWFAKEKPREYKKVCKEYTDYNEKTREER